MALVVSMGWILLGGIILLYKFGEKKLGGSVSSLCSCLLWPALFFGVVALCMDTEFGGFVIWGAVFGTIMGILVGVSATGTPTGDNFYYGIIAFVTYTAVFSLVCATGLLPFQDDLIPLPMIFITLGLAIVIGFYYVYMVLTLLGFRTNKIH